MEGRSYVGSDSPRVAASTPGSSYPFSMHGVGRGGMCICMYVYVYMYVCMYVCMASVSRARSAAAGVRGLAEGLGYAGNAHVTLELRCFCSLGVTKEKKRPKKFACGRPTDVSIRLGL